MNKPAGNVYNTGLDSCVCVMSHIFFNKMTKITMLNQSYSLLIPFKPITLLSKNETKSKNSNLDYHFEILQICFLFVNYFHVL